MLSLEQEPGFPGYCQSTAAAEATGTTPEIWRRRAAEGRLPGAMLVLHRWLIPISHVEYYARHREWPVPTAAKRERRRRMAAERAVRESEEPSVGQG